MAALLDELAERHLGGRAPLPDAIARVLRDAVLGGAFAPNARLHQDDLARRFNVSRIPVREALLKLVADGLAVQLPNRGIRVAQLSQTDFRDVTELRLLLEPHALRVSAPALTTADLAAAEDLLHQVRRHEPGMEAAALHWRFHTTLYRRADRPRLLAQIDATHLAINRYLLPIWQRVGLAEDWDESHAAIIDALRRGEIDEAAEMTRLQIEEAADRVLGAIAQLPAATQ